MQWRKGLGAAGAIVVGVAVTALLAVGGQSLTAQEMPPMDMPPAEEAPPPEGAPAAPPEGTEAPAAASPLEGAKQLVDEARAKLNPDVVDSLSESAVKPTAQTVINLLEGENGEHFDASTPVSDPHGAIPYLEDATGRSAAELAAGDLEAVAASTDESPEVVALAHLVMADQALTAGEASQEVLQEAATHIDEAHEILTGAAGSTSEGAPAEGGDMQEEEGTY